MSDQQDSAPAMAEAPNLDEPSAARIYDYYLDGDANWAIDREFARRAMKLVPQVKPIARMNRQWLSTVVTEAIAQGVTQFLDLGAGIPTAGSTHETALAQAPDGADVRVVYVDNEPVATAHGNALLERSGAAEHAGMVQADLRDPEGVFSDETTQQLLDLTEPVCVLLVAVLHFVGGDDDVPGLLARYRRELAPGSWVAISQMCHDDALPADAEALERFRAAYADTQNPAWIRDRAEISGWFDGLTLLEPGVVHQPQWRPAAALTDDPDVGRIGSFNWCGVGRIG